MRAFHPPSSNRLPAIPPRRCRRAFTLVEIMIVVVIIGLLASMAMATFKRLRDRSIATRFVNDVRQFANAFETYAIEEGEWPPETGPGAVPVGMEDRIPVAWNNPPTVGGQWDWNVGTVVAIGTAGPTIGDDVMLRIDGDLDDGNPSTGNFIQDGGNWNYILAAGP